MSKEIAKGLLSIGAVVVRPNDPFTWASGIKSPIYCDNRLTLTAPEVRTQIETAMAALIREKFPQAEVLMGTSTAGIAHAAITAHLMGLPMGYVRGSAKDHGKKNRIEGRLLPGEKTVVVEDLISTGGSSLDVVDALREAGADVLGVVSIFTYGLARAEELFREKDTVSYSLTGLDELAAAAAETGVISQEEIGKVLAFRDSLSA